MKQKNESTYIQSNSKVDNTVYYKNYIQEKTKTAQRIITSKSERDTIRNVNIKQECNVLPTAESTITRRRE